VCFFISHARQRVQWRPAFPTPSVVEGSINSRREAVDACLNLAV
jgi:hypothetical protein